MSGQVPDGVHTRILRIDARLLVAGDRLARYRKTGPASSTGCSRSASN